MAYSKQTWVRGEKVASTKLNHMEDGIYENSVTLEHGIEAAVDNWLDEHPEATTTVQDGSLTTVKFANVVTPDQFAGTDSQKLAAAINSLVNGGIVLLGRTYTLTEDVVINRISSAPKVTVKGINSSGLINCASYTFTGTNRGNDGNICFDGVIFKGDTSNGLFDAYYLIRMYFTNCSFSNFASIVYNSRSNQERVYIQSYYFMNCCIRHIYDYIIKLTNGASTIDWIIDVRFTENNIEWCHSGLAYGNYYQGFVFSNNALEGFVTEDALVTRVLGARGFVFNDNYFEKNKCTYIDMTAPVKNSINAEIANNMIMEDTTENVNFLLLPLVNTPGMIRIINNFVDAKTNSGCYFIYVNDSVTEQLSNVLVEGTYYASTHLQLKHDTNDRIKTTESFSVLNDQYKILEKVSPLVDTSSGNTKTLAICLMGTALNSNTVAMVANIPFYLQSYSVELIKVEMVNLGNITANSSVYGTLRNNGFEIRATGLSVTSGSTYTGYATVKLTFA